MKVSLLVLGEAPPRLAADLLVRLTAPFSGGEVVLGTLPLATCFDRQRVQLDALRLLETIPAPADGWSTLAVTGADLFLPALAYVFGLSALGSRRGVVSWARLAAEETGLHAGEVLLRRLTIEAAHELGHGLGLLHCVVPDCAMHRSLWPEAVDLKKPDYCPTCLEGLALAVG
ncbi:MAG: archaemetzincin [Acidobacteriota bacterium]